jgi:Calcineurin-like phosphoesterase.
MILWTGDSTAHDVLTQNPTMQINNTLQITQVLKKYFNTEAVYAIQGNHEAYPVNVMDFYDNTSYWLSSQLSDIWKGWIDEEAYNNFRQKGFYAQVDKKHNVRIIAVDTNACNNLNFDLYQNPTDPYGQLAYIRDQLYQAEKANQSVFIMGHIPPGSGDCVPGIEKLYQFLNISLECSLQCFG